MLSKCNLYCDASYKNGIAAWAFVLELLGHSVEGRGLADRTSINRAELEAVINGLKRVPFGFKVSVYTDSIYVVRGSTNPNRYQSDLWIEYFELERQFNLKVSKIKNHPSHTRAHHLARELVIK